MILDNETNIISLRKSKNIIVSFFILFLTLSWFEIISVIPWYYPFAILLGSLALFLFIWHKQEFTYIRYTDADNSLEFKYYRIVVVNPKRKMIKIKKSLFAKFEIEKNGKNEKLYLFQKTKTGNFKYPYINISNLSKVDKNKLRINLTKYANQKK